MEKVRITFTMEADLKARIEKIARAERRDFSAQLAWLAESAIKQMEADAKTATRGRSDG